jgi:beta-ketoacyl synthase
MTGHLLGAAGAIESVACIMAMQHSLVPPTINLHEVDPAIDPSLQLTPNKPVAREIRYALSNTFGFGGHNSSLIFKKNA